jgi:hypothetical protein
MPYLKHFSSDAGQTERCSNFFYGKSEFEIFKFIYLRNQTYPLYLP